VLPQLPDHYMFLDEPFDLDGLSWNSMFRFLDSHPQDLFKLRGDCGSVNLLSCENRPSFPFSNIVQNLLHQFPGKPITAHVFFGITDRHTTFGIHRDKMHVLYMQILGKVDWEIHKPRRKDAMADVLTPERSKLVEHKILKPGDMVWNPKGTYHHSKPVGTRMGVSFGVEGLDK